MAQRDEYSAVLQARAYLGANLRVVVLGCLLLAALGGFVTYQSFTGPGTTTEERTVATWTAEDELRHGAVVQRDTRAFDAGAVLRNRSVYFSSVTPVLNGSYVFHHDGDADPATVRTDLRLVVRAVEVGGGESVLWRVSERVASERTASLEPGDELAVPFEFNVTAQSELAERVRRELGSSRGEVQIRLVADTTVSVTVAGETFDGDRTATLAVTPRGDSYGVTTTTAGQRREPVTERITVPVEPDPVARYGGLLALVVGLASPPDELVVREPLAELLALVGQRLLKGGDLGTVKADEPPDGVPAIVPRVVVIAPVGVADVVAQHPDRGHCRRGHSRGD